jgi:hypothetical protein
MGDAARLGEGMLGPCLNLSCFIGVYQYCHPGLKNRPL